MSKRDEKRVRRWVLAAATLGYALVILDVTAMNVVAPVIQQELDASVSLVQWVINAYTLFLAALLLLGGTLADRYGRRFILGVGAVLFGVASLAAALAPQAHHLIIARAVQGIGSALLVPAGLGLIAAHWDVGNRGRAIGLWGGISGLAAIGGPLLGGLLSDLASWRWLFFLYLPLAFVVLIIVITRVPSAPRPPDPRPLDLPGAALATLGFFGIVFALIRAGEQSFSDPWVTAGLLGGGLLLALFLLVEKRTRKPMLELDWFRDRDHAGANWVTFWIYFALAAGMLFVPMRLLGLEGWRPMWAGVAMLPTLAMIGLLAPRFGALLPRWGGRRLVAAGCLVAGAGYLILALPGADTPYFAGLFWGLTVVGLGMAMVVAPITATVLATVDDKEAARAAGLNNGISRLGALFAIAMAGVVALAVQGGVIAAELDELGLDDETQQEAWEARKDLAQATPPPTASAEQQERLQALYHAGFLAGYRAVQLIMMAAAVVAGISAWLVLTPRAGR